MQDHGSSHEASTLKKGCAKLRLFWMLLSQYHGATRTQMLFHYLRFLTKKKLLVDALGLTIRRERFLGFTVDVLSYRTFIQLFEELFIINDYRFEAETRSPQIVDCGSNIGMSIIYFKFLYPEASIIAFEPSPHAFRLLQKNVEQNHFRNVRLVNAAVHNQDGQLPFYYDAGEHHTLNESLRSDMGHQAVVQVSTVRLSKYIDQPVDLLKLDVEGVATLVLDELATAGKMGLIKQVVIEFERLVRMRERGIAAGLATLESAGFDYQLQTQTFEGPAGKQDELVFTYASRRG